MYIHYFYFFIGDIGTGDQVPIASGMHRQPQPSTSTGTFDV